MPWELLRRSCTKHSTPHEFAPADSAQTTNAYRSSTQLLAAQLQTGGLGGVCAQRVVALQLLYHCRHDSCTDPLQTRQLCRSPWLHKQGAQADLIMDDREICGGPGLLAPARPRQLVRVPHEGCLVIGLRRGNLALVAAQVHVPPRHAQVRLPPEQRQHHTAHVVCTWSLLMGAR